MRYGDMNTANSSILKQKPIRLVVVKITAQKSKKALNSDADTRIRFKKNIAYEIKIR